MTYTRKNKGVCSLSTEVTLTDDGVIESVTVVGGCNGNLKGISALLTGLRAEDAIRRLKGLTCGSKHTSCPDQIALALEEALENLKRATRRYAKRQLTWFRRNERVHWLCWEDYDTPGALYGEACRLVQESDWGRIR